MRPLQRRTRRASSSRRHFIAVALKGLESGGAVPAWFVPLMVLIFLPMIGGVLVLSAISFCCYQEKKVYLAFGVRPMGEALLADNGNGNGKDML